MVPSPSALPSQQRCEARITRLAPFIHAKTCGELIPGSGQWNNKRSTNGRDCRLWSDHVWSEQEMPQMPASSAHLAMKVWAAVSKESRAGIDHLNWPPVLGRSQVGKTPASLRQLRSRLARVLFSAILACPTLASAHDSWISRYKLHDPNSGEWCCNENDCSALDETRIVETKEGYVVDRKFFVPSSRAIPSYDGQYWACFNPGGLHGHGPKRDVRCFFAPLNS